MLPGKIGKGQHRFLGTIDGLVIQIRDIHDMGNIIAAQFKITAQQIGKHKTAAFPQMHARMGCGAA